MSGPRRVIVHGDAHSPDGKRVTSPHQLAHGLLLQAPMSALGHWRLSQLGG